MSVFHWYAKWIWRKIEGKYKNGIAVETNDKDFDHFSPLLFAIFSFAYWLFVFCKKYHIFIPQNNPHKNIQILMFKFRAIEDVAKKTDILNALKMR